MSQAYFSSRWLIVGIIVLMLALLGCESDAQYIRATNEAYGTPSTSNENLSAEIAYKDIQDGDCMRSVNYEDLSLDVFESVVIVPCSGIWQYRVLSSFTVFDLRRYPGEDFFAQESSKRCDQDYTSIFFPLVELWDLGERIVHCLYER